VATWGFTGELQQGDAVYLRARWYQPSAGTLLGRDLWSGDTLRPQTLQPYQYVGNSPINLTDPSGRCYDPIAWLRTIEPLNCSNLDQAIAIYNHPHASPEEIDYAAAYIGFFLFGHDALVAGALGLAVASAPGIAAWGGAYLTTHTMTATVVGGATVAASTADEAVLLYGIATGDANAAGAYMAQQHLAAADGPLPFGDLYAAGNILIRRGRAIEDCLPIEQFHLFRGTSEGWLGHPSLQKVGISPTSTDPAIATIFAIESTTQGGKGVVHIAASSDLAGVHFEAPNTRAEVELEVPVGVSPSEFAQRASITITVEQAREILAGMGIPTPPRIYGKRAIEDAIIDTPRMSPEQTQEFIEQARRVGQ
jgi:RHS repeat-associated protein